MPATGVAQTSFTESTSHHTHALYFGTLTLTRAGQSSPYLVVEGFESEIRVSQQGANQIAAKLGNDPRIAAGFAGTAPDGGSWITNQPDPDWWELPNHPNHPKGPGHPEQHTFPNAGARFLAAIDPASHLAPGETAACTDSAADFVLRDSGDPGSSGVSGGSGDFPTATRLTDTTGPATIGIGPDHSQPHFVPSGWVNTNLEYIFLVVDAHRLDRACTVTVSGDTDPPETTITKGPKKKLRSKKSKKRVTFEFESDEPGATFECSIDGTPFEPCTSPYKTVGEKKKKAKHTFEVRAIDSAGNVDTTPDDQTWKLKKPKRK